MDHAVLSSSRRRSTTATLRAGRMRPAMCKSSISAGIFAKYYAGLGAVEIPLGEANFARFGSSTTPTMVVVDGQGIVRLYNPGNASYELLAAKIEAALRPAGRADGQAAETCVRYTGSIQLLWRDGSARLSKLEAFYECVSYRTGWLFHERCGPGCRQLRDIQ